MASLSALKARKREKERELRDFRTRKTKLEKIKKDVETDFEDTISDSISYNEKTMNELEDGLKGEELSVGVICGDIESNKERALYSDTNMFDIISNINNEISRCDNEIDRLEREIASLERQIESEKNSEG